MSWWMQNLSGCVRNLSKEKGRNRNTFFHPFIPPTFHYQGKKPDFKFNFQSRKWVFDTYCFLHKSCCCNAPGIFHANTSLCGFPLLYFPLFHMTLQERFREISAQFRGKNHKKWDTLYTCNASEGGKWK